MPNCSTGLAPNSGSRCSGHVAGRQQLHAVRRLAQQRPAAEFDGRQDLRRPGRARRRARAAVRPGLPPARRAGRRSVPAAGSPAPARCAARARAQHERQQLVVAQRRRAERAPASRAAGRAPPGASQRASSAGRPRPTGPRSDESAAPVSGVSVDVDFDDDRPVPPGQDRQGGRRMHHRTSADRPAATSHASAASNAPPSTAASSDSPNQTMSGRISAPHAHTGTAGRTAAPARAGLVASRATRRGPPHRRAHTRAPDVAVQFQDAPAAGPLRAARRRSGSPGRTPATRRSSRASTWCPAFGERRADRSRRHRYHSQTSAGSRANAPAWRGPSGR